ncbi:hypothetical protein V500_00890 [Pseudogymnoascus sp. VKM F-4518 (FW-2643)]|nr:hypothetical protein V500_00890 [Pseudogymnoascus sp. VKM F-4518 (FW-2643)]
MTKIIISADDQVYWGRNFLRYALAPFNDAHVGLVGTVNRVDWENFPLFSFRDILNYIAVMYLERSNFELTATSNIDGGVSTISGRTVLMRTDMVKNPNFAHEYLNETWLFGMRGPLLVDDDKFLTRWCWSQGWKTVFYNHEEALMHTSIAVTRWSQLSPKMHRWARTSWRSKPTEIFVERHVWRQQPWSVYATYFATTLNIALIYDSLLWWTLSRSGWATGSMYAYFGLLLLASKLIKPLPHLRRCKRDILYIPIGILFGYYHGFIRLWAVATAYNISWGSRGLKAASQPPPVAKSPAARHEASVAPSAAPSTGFGMDAARKKDTTTATTGTVPLSPSQLSDVLGKYQRGIHGHEVPQATSYAVGLLGRHRDQLGQSPEGTHRRTRRFTIAV